MSEEQNTDGQQAGSEQQSDFKPITSQEEFERALGKRLERERSKFADYDDLKSKASKYEELEESKKSELQKAQERIQELEGRATQAERTALQARIAAEEGVIPEVLTGNTEEEMRAAAKRVLDWANQGKRATPEPKRLKSGSSSGEQTGGSRAAAAVRALRNQ